MFLGKSPKHFAQSPKVILKINFEKKTSPRIFSLGTYNAVLTTLPNTWQEDQKFSFSFKINAGNVPLDTREVVLRLLSVD